MKVYRWAHPRTAGDVVKELRQKESSRFLCLVISKPLHKIGGRIIGWLVGGLVAINLAFSQKYWVSKNHPNWRNPEFFRGVAKNHQADDMLRFQTFTESTMDIIPEDQKSSLNSHFTLHRLWNPHEIPMKALMVMIHSVWSPVIFDPMIFRHDFPNKNPSFSVGDDTFHCFGPTVRDSRCQQALMCQRSRMDGMGNIGNTVAVNCSVYS